MDNYEIAHSLCVWPKSISDRTRCALNSCISNNTFDIQNYKITVIEQFLLLLKWQSFIYHRIM